jgi:acyl carrier protein
MLAQGEYVAPETETEQTLVEIWAKLLKLEPQSISVTANFFELGGHSLLLVRLLTAIEEATSFRFDLRQIYVNASIKEMAELTDYYQLEQKLKSSKGDKKNKNIERVEF